MLLPDRGARGAVLPTYRYYLLNDRGAIMGRDDFDAQDDKTAVAVAELVSGTCSDQASSFELWRGTERVRAAKAPAHVPPKAACEEPVQQAAMDLELVLRDSRSKIAESRRLLRTLREWEGRGELIPGVFGGVSAA